MLSRKKVDFQFMDDRGTLVQLIHDGYKQINVIISKKNTFRGGHYHKENKEAFYIVSGLLDVVVNGTKSTFAAGDFFEIEENDVHSFYFLEETTLVSMYSSGVEKADGQKDIYTES